MAQSAARPPPGSVLNLPFQGRLLPLMQRVNEWQAVSATYGEIRDAQIAAPMSVNGSDDVFDSLFPGLGKW